MNDLDKRLGDEFSALYFDVVGEFPSIYAKESMLVYFHIATVKLEIKAALDELLTRYHSVIKIVPGQERPPTFDELIDEAIAKLSVDQSSGRHTTSKEGE